ncbi:MAG TPA: YheU family protein [Bdellovibrionales bacterium]|nr:YheU family protein [Bdellovibrionales bacterium]
MDPSKDQEKPIEVSPELLSDEALAGIIESFILREGTDYGSVEVSYDKKAEQIRKQIARGDVKIVFDQSSETLSLLTKDQFKRRSLGER